MPTLKARASRAARLGSACQAVREACELLREKYDEEDADWLSQVNDVEALVEEAEGVEFP